MALKGAIFLVLVISVPNIYARKLPSFVTPCKRTNPDIPKCWTAVVESMRSHMKAGIPELGIPPCDPLTIPRLEMKQPDGASVGFNAVLTNLTFDGGLDFRMNNIQVDLDKGYFYMEINFPRLVMTGNYRAQGKVLLITFEGDGIAHGDYGNVTLYATYQDERIKKNGKEYFRVAHKNTTVDVSSIKVQFDNLFKNNPEITANTNRLINENSEILFFEIKPIIEQTIGDLVTSVVEAVNARYTTNELFPN